MGQPLLAPNQRHRRGSSLYRCASSQVISWGFRVQFPLFCNAFGPSATLSPLTMRPAVHFIGRFPPPVDGQSLATQRLARMLEGAFDVRAVNTAVKDQSLMPSGLLTQLRTSRHYLQLRPDLRHSLASAPDAPVLWGSISPTALGHARDTMATLPCFQPGQSIIAIAHRGGFDRIFRNKLTARSALRLARTVNRFVFLSEYLSSQVAQWVPAEKRTVIPYTVEACATPYEITLKQQARSSGDPLKLLYLSNMIASKGYPDVLEAMALARVNGVPVTATFAGRWNSEKDRLLFHDRVSALALDREVVHVGAVQDRDKVNALHREADIFLLPSYYSEEAQPISIIEALSAATPVIVTRHSGIRDMVRGDMEARFVPPKSPETIAEAITSLSDADTWHAASKDARTRYEQHFSESAVRKKWMALLSEHVKA